MTKNIQDIMQDRIKNRLDEVVSVSMDDLLNIIANEYGVDYAMVHKDYIENFIHVDEMVLSILKDEAQIPGAEVLIKMYLLGVLRAKVGGNL
ncbi:hypothetical protein [Cellulosilyticum sp. WCF-2]|uniref:hypothetical protein n=1 Tax=Cellulosilyticum sp. WCF-2 TaxID=2497860 RepID=UPI000F8F5C67|nr:hypothetical protein [Cellulosilyticum sp. WCF-2]QEH70504.1 hypothetical protein EKH84_19700 [Cellulosilyticum sp. WCF-2]